MLDATVMEWIEKFESMSTKKLQSLVLGMGLCIDDKMFNAQFPQVKYLHKLGTLELELKELKAFTTV